jgi:hypothetical protein
MPTWMDVLVLVSCIAWLILFERAFERMLRRVRPRRPR